jgi:hypothetical protein
MFLAFLHSQFCQQSNSIAGYVATKQVIFCWGDIPMYNIETLKNVFNAGVQDNL